MKEIIYFAFALLALIVLPGIEHHASAEDKTYTNNDLGNYKGANGGTVIGDRPLPQGREKNPAAKDKDERSQQYWCSKASAYRAKIEKAKAKVDDSEQNLATLDSQKSDNNNLKSYKKNHAAARKKLKSAQKELSQSEKALDELEQKAHRENIPPGWLRCQFHY